MKLMDRLVIRQSKEPEDNKTHILWHDSKTLKGYGSRRLFKGTYQECLEEKERRTPNVPKSKGYSFRLLKKALHNR